MKLRAKYARLWGLREFLAEAKLYRPLERAPAAAHPDNVCPSLSEVHRAEPIWREFAARLAADPAACLEAEEREMVTSAFNKRHDDNRRGSILGIDADAIARLPHQFRGELIAALADAEDALASGDEAEQRAAAARVTKLLGAIEARRSEAITEKAFVDFMRPVAGDHAVMKKFATHVGVRV